MTVLIGVDVVKSTSQLKTNFDSLVGSVPHGFILGDLPNYHHPVNMYFILPPSNPAFQITSLQGELYFKSPHLEIIYFILPHCQLLHPYCVI